MHQQAPAETKSAKPKGEATPTNTYHWYTPRFWVGMLVTTWWRLLWRHRIRATPRSWGMIFTTSLITPFNSLCRPWQEFWYGKAIDLHKIEQPPVFIIGHWRSGTTFLHELMMLDPANTYASTYDCFAPNHFLVSGWWLPKMFWFLLPSRRPMDNVAAGWDRPQEDEFALMNMGLPSPYLTMAFPNDPPEAQNYLDMSGLTEEEHSAWKRGLLRFMQALSLRDKKRIVLKSPPHTGRIKTLVEMFPDARFIHIVRDPQVLFPSTMRLWKSLYQSQAMNSPPYWRLEEHVLESMERMYRAFEAHKHLIPAEQFCEVRYEDLAQDPLGQLRTIYERLSLGDFEKVRPHVTPFLETVKDFKVNRHQMDPETLAKVAARWGDYARRYGYELEAGATGTANG